MRRKLAITMLVIIAYSPCIRCSSGISASFFGRLQDPRQVDRWIIRSNPSLRSSSNHDDVFATPYLIVAFEDLRKDQQGHAMSIIYQTIDSEKIETVTSVKVASEMFKVWSQQHAAQKAKEYMKENPEYKWTGSWTNKGIEFIHPDWSTMAVIASRCSIWKQFGWSNYLISCRQYVDNDETVFVIGAGKKVLWTDKMDRRDEPPGPSERFPHLMNCKLIDNEDALFELHGNYKATVLENRRLKVSNEDLEGQIDDIKLENFGLRSTNEELADELVHIRSENENLENRITALEGEQRENASNQRIMNESLRTEQDAHKSLKESHHQMMIGGAIGLGFTMMLVLLIITASSRRKRRSRHSSGSGTEGVPAVEGQTVLGVLGKYRPRSRTTEEVHHKFGMNEVYKVTPKEGSDLVRIARPLETAGAERKLSEELLGIEPIISDGNEGTKQTNAIGTKSGSDGEEGAGP